MAERFVLCLWLSLCGAFFVARDGCAGAISFRREGQREGRCCLSCAVGFAASSSS